MGLESARLQAVLEDVAKKLPLPKQDKAPRFEDADGALACAGYVLAQCLTGAYACYSRAINEINTPACSHACCSLPMPAFVIGLFSSAYHVSSLCADAAGRPTLAGAQLQDILTKLAACLGALDAALAASSAASLGLVGLRQPLALPPGDLASVRWAGVAQHNRTMESPHTGVCRASACLLRLIPGLLGCLKTVCVTWHCLLFMPTPQHVRAGKSQQQLESLVQHRKCGSATSGCAVLEMHRAADGMSPAVLAGNVLPSNPSRLTSSQRRPSLSRTRRQRSCWAAPSCWPAASLRYVPLCV